MNIQEFTQLYHHRFSVQDDGCWVWKNNIKSNGYGSIWMDGRSRGVHRVAYEIAVGPIPTGLQIDHLCRVRACMNPSHLEAVTSKENIRRGNTAQWQRDKTHCPSGHPYSGDNLYVHGGKRYCRSCSRASSRRYYRANLRRLENSYTRLDPSLLV